MARNVKIVLAVIIIVIGLCIVSSNYYFKLKHEVFDEMNKLYYEQNVIVEELPDDITNEDIVDKDNSTKVDEPSKEEPIEPTTTTKIETYIGYINIPKINLNRGFYDFNSKQNNVNKNIYVHPNSTYPNKSGNNLILASHSGTSSISYFKNLYKLELNDDVYINYNNTNYHYRIKNIYTVPKDGTVALRINEKVSTVSLITCTKNDKTTQTIYICELVQE